MSWLRGGPKSMKRVIRNKKSGKFLAGDGQWTTDVRAARVFPRLRVLCAALQGLDVNGLESILMMGEEPSGRYDIVVPLPFVDLVGGTRRQPGGEEGESHA